MEFFGLYMKIYADNAATTKISNAALNKMTQVYQDCFANPSSDHFFGREAKNELQNSRKLIKELIHASPSDYLLFTSGGTESDNHAIKIIRDYSIKTGKKHIITSIFEHKAILEPLKQLSLEGFDIELLPVDRKGIISPQTLLNSIREDTAAVSIMFVNNEIGTIENIQEIGQILSQRNIIFHTDAVQAVGHLPIDVCSLNISMLSASAHKFHGPKGIGFLYINKNISPIPYLYGGSQEMGLRAGTQNVPAIAGMAVALKEALENHKEKTLRLEKYSNRIISELISVGATLNGDINQRLLSTISLSFNGVNGESLRYILENNGICVSAGSACNSYSGEISHVLKAIGLDNNTALSTIRISIDENYKEEEIDYLIKTIKEQYLSLKNMKSFIKK